LSLIAPHLHFDDRAQGTGLYDNLKKYNLPQAEAIFELSYLRKNPKPFFTLAKELYPGDFSPTPAHFWIKLLSDKCAHMLASACWISTRFVTGAACCAHTPRTSMALSCL
jgi:hypothetical protein